MEKLQRRLKKEESMEKLDHLKRYEIIELKHYRNKQIGNLIDENFNSEKEKRIAWKTINLIKELYPEFEKILRGSLIHKQKQEVLNETI